ncbi:Ig-like domain repeat protein, partial [Variovorax paradoxus]|uniref:Ig-like domain repeat protein n=1 Tax=Variovorax paradoxus TaxID=34073 RepID=UPI002782E4BF
MVAIVSGNSLGLSLSSLATLGQRGQVGMAGQGRSGEQAYVNAATGNLVLQTRDELLLGRGPDTVSLRTYNSQGLLSDDNADNWAVGAFGQRMLLTGTVATAGSTLTRTDRDGAQAVYTWDAARSLYVSTAGAGAFDTIAYDAGASEFVWTDGDSELVERYQSTGQGRLASATDASGNTVSYAYNGNGTVKSVTNANGEVTYYDYSGTNLTQIRTVSAAGATSTRVRYAYDGLNRLTKVTVDLSPDDNSVADGQTYVTTYTYEGASRRVAGVSQSDGTSLAFTYVQAGGVYKVQSVTDALGAVTTFAYDTAAGTTTVTDALGASAVYLYDAQGQLVQVRQGVTAANTAGLSQVSYAYDTSGNVTLVTDGEGHKVALTYDELGNLLKEVDAAGDTRTRTYGAANQLLTDTLYADAAVSRGAFSKEAALPETVRYVYAQNNPYQLRFVVSGQGNVTEYSYDAYGLRTSAVEYAGAPYDTAALAQTAVPTEAQMVTWRQGQDLTRSQRTDYTYDGRGELQTATTYGAINASGQGDAATAATTQYIYDPHGLLLQTIAPAIAGGTAAVTTYTYDGLGRLLSASGPSLDGGVTPNTTITSYDDANGKTSVTLANGLVTISAYDKAGRLVSITQTSVGTGVLGTTSYAYDKDGNLLMTQDPTGVRQWMLYDAADRKVADIDATGAVIEYVYNANGQLRETIAYTTRIGTAALIDGSGTPTTAWSATNTTTSLTALRPAGTPQDQKVWRFYDTANRLTWQVDALGYVTQTTYDGASRILSVTQLANPIDVTQLGNGANVQILVDAATVGGVTLGVSAGTSPLGSAVTLTANIEGTSPGGMVTFFSGETVIGSAPVVNGVATLSTTELPIGVDSIRAAYSGDTLRPASISPVVQKTITGATTSAALSFSPSYGAVYGQSVTLSMWLTTSQPPGLAPATGEVKFYNGTTLVGTAVVINGLAMLTASSLPVGSLSIRAEYAGDTTHAAATSYQQSLTVNPNPTKTALLVSGSGSTLNLSATVGTAFGPSTLPGGTVTFYNGTTVVGIATLANGVASIQIAAPANAAAFKAVYAGDAGNATSNSSGASSTTLPSPTSTTLTASAASMTQGQPVTLTAQVAGAAPGGKVSFFAGMILLGTASVVNGQASLVTNYLPTGSVTVSAAYAGDANNAGSVIAQGPTIQVTAGSVTAPAALNTTVYFTTPYTAEAGVPVSAGVSAGGSSYNYTGTFSLFDGNTLVGSFMASSSSMASLPQALLAPFSQGTHSLTVVYSGDPSTPAGKSSGRQLVVGGAQAGITLTSSRAQSTVGSPLTVTANVRPTNSAYLGAAAAGTVTFYSNGVAIGTSSVINGAATLTLSNLALGTDAITASYSGDANFAAASSATFSQQILATPASTYVSVTSAPDASFYGSTLTLTATPTGQGKPEGGSVSFYDGTTLLAIVTLVNGKGVLSVSNLEVGSHTIKAVYSGDANNATSTSYAYPIIAKAPAGLTNLTAASIAQDGSLSVQVGGIAPSGLISFYEGIRLLGTAQIVNGVATLSGVALPPGTHSFTAAYSGDAHYLDGEIGFTQVVQGTPLTTIYAALDILQDRTVTEFYNRDGRLQGTLDAEGYLTEYKYNAAGDLVQTIGYANRAANFANVSARIAAVAITRASYNLSGLRPGTNSSADINSYNLYDAQRRLVGQVDGEGYLTETVYDTRGNVTQTKRYANKAVGVSASATLASVRPGANAQDQTVTQTWSAANQLLTRTNAEGTVTQFAYDSVGQLVQATTALGTAEARTSRQRYDIQGRLIGELDGRGSDAVALTDPLALWAANGLTHTYDAAGRRASTTDANGHRTLFFYDPIGRLAYTVNALGEVTESKYNA